MAIEEVIEYIKHLDSQIDTSAIKNIRIPEECAADSLCFAFDDSNLDVALSNNSPLIFVPENLFQKLENPASSIRPLVPMPYQQAKILEAFAMPAGGKHKTGILSELPDDVRLGDDVAIGAQTVIGKNVQLGDGVRILGQVYVGDGAKIGGGTLIYPGAYIGAGSVIGKDCIIHNNSSIGADGFGFTEDVEKGGILKVHQIGNVELGDAVEIGALCAIDKGAIGSTRIGSHTKLDNFVHIGHNVQIGSYCMITAGFVIGGSSTIGDRFKCGGRAIVTGHVSICDDVMLGGLSAVTKDITEPGNYGGHPLQPMKDYLRTQSSFTKLPEIRKELKALRKNQQE